MSILNSFRVATNTIIISVLVSIFPLSKSYGAESIILKYGFLQDSISVPELSKFSQTGETSTKLDYYLKTARQDPDRVRWVLSQKITVNGLMLSKMLNNSLGDLFLDSISEVITTPSAKASRQSLRGAIITSAIEDNDISLMEVIENYPTQEVHIEGDRLLEIYQQMKGVLSQIPSF